ncbi:MAG: hypothetical protein HYY04_18770 [Chloroflexi bacterium]|nr:hypothetical protein [Chloroflexota bacterium]
MQPLESANRTGSGPALQARRPLTPLQLLFLRRFQSLLEKRQQYTGRVPPSDLRLHLIDKVLYSTYCDCAGCGIGDEAKDLLRRQRGMARFP